MTITIPSYKRKSSLISSKPWSIILNVFFFQFSSIVACILPLCMKAWNTAHLDDYRLTTLDIFLNRRSLTIEELKKIRVPVKLIQGLEDVAYPREYAEEFLHRLQDAGVDASLESIPGAPHFACIENHAT